MCDGQTRPHLMMWYHQRSPPPSKVQTPGTLFSLIIISQVATGARCPGWRLPWQHRQHHQGESWWLVITEVSLPGGRRELQRIWGGGGIYCTSNDSSSQTVGSCRKGRKYICLYSESSAISDCCIGWQEGNTVGFVSQTPVKGATNLDRNVTVRAEKPKGHLIAEIVM